MHEVPASVIFDAKIWVFPWHFVCPSDPSTAVQYSMDGSTVYTKIMITKSLAIDVTPKQNVLLSLNCITMKKNKFQMCNTDIVRG